MSEREEMSRNDFLLENLKLSKQITNLKQQRDDLLTELADYKEGCEGLKLSIQDLRPVAECYRRACESLGIEKDILGYVKKLTEQRDDLLEACKYLIGDKTSADIARRLCLTGTKIQRIMAIIAAIAKVS